MKATLGIVGGGQLGRMLALASKDLNISTLVLDPTPKSPAGKVTDQLIGSYTKSAPIKKLASSVDYLTWEIEGANSKALLELNNKGHNINPHPSTLEVIQDKLAQKQLLLANEIPTAQFIDVKAAGDIEKAAEYLGYPLILKSRFHGFDGRGNAFIGSKKDIKKALKKLAGSQLLVEKFIPFSKELAIQFVRSQDGKTKLYPIVETIQQDGICHIVKFPAKIDQKTKLQAINAAKKVSTLFTGAGLFAIEMFESGGKILVNEIAPRVHNSGHWTIEGTFASQFENHVRAVTNKSLKSAKPKVKAAVMINILGDRNGKSHPEGVEKAENLSGVYVHLYDKAQTRKQRKMGHITAIDTTVEKALAKAQKARKLISI